MKTDLGALQKDHQSWGRIPPFFFDGYRGDMSEIVKAAFSSIDHWHAIPNTERDDAQSGSVNGALTVIGHSMKQKPENAYSICRQIAAYFYSPNINCAFTAIRSFEYFLFSGCTIFIADKLVECATWAQPTRSPVPMTLRGIAFCSLFTLDPMYNHWPQLQSARDECIAGLKLWHPDKQSHISTLTKMTRYRK